MESQLLKTHQQIRNKYEGIVVWFECKGFIECIAESAETTSLICDLPLTERVEYKMCGFSGSNADLYLHKMLKGGYKVAIVEQVI